MYILKNAIRSISRSKGRNILTGIIIFVIAISSCISLSIGEAAKKAKTESISNLEVKGQIVMNRQEMMKAQSSHEDMKNSLMNSSDISLEDMNEYAQSQYVKNFYYTSSVSINGTDDFEAIDTSGTSDSNSSDDSQSSNTQGSNSQNGSGSFSNPQMGSDGQSDSSGSKKNNGMGPMGVQGDFTLTGYSSDDAMTDFLSGSSTITEGSMFSQNDTENNCIISSALAVYNDVGVGDTITLVNPNDEDMQYTFTICGIYESSGNSDSTQNMMGGFSAAFNSENKIYTSYENTAKIVEESEENAETTTNETTGREVSTALKTQVTGTYVFSSIEDYNSFKEETDEKLPEYYTVTSEDVSDYEESTALLENLSKYSSYFLAVVLIIGGIILVVINIFNIRERKYEIGVLAAIGMKKYKIAVQFLMELLCVTFVAVIIGTAAGAACSVPVANKLLEQQMQSEQEKSDKQNEQFKREVAGPGNASNVSGTAPSNQAGVTPGSSASGDGSNVSAPSGQNTDKNYISEISEATDIVVIIKLIAIGLILTLVSGCVSIVFILRYDPLRILSNRD